MPHSFSLLPLPQMLCSLGWIGVPRNWPFGSSFSLRCQSAVASTISSGARIEIDYPLRVYARRRMFPDRRIWKGVARSTVTFDAITGRYLCQLIVNGSTTVSREVDSVEFALQWLKAPPAVEVPLPKGRRTAFLRVRARAVFSSGTTWLVFPSTEGTDWVEVKLEAQRDEE